MSGSEANCPGKGLPGADGPGPTRRAPMLELTCLAILVAFFAVAVLFVRGCERLEDEED